MSPFTVHVRELCPYNTDKGVLDIFVSAYFGHCVFVFVFVFSFVFVFCLSRLLKTAAHLPMRSGSVLKI